MSSCILYHGPGAREAALYEADRLGRLLAPPFGDAGLKVDDAREVVHLLSFVPVGVAKGTVVVGPMDSSYTASDKARDVLLKRIEEFPSCVQPILWAHDLGDVQGTIRSRCVERWANGDDDSAMEDDILQAANELVNAALKKEHWVVPGILAEVLKAKKGEKGEKKERREAALLQAATDILAEMESPGRFVLWAAIRAASRHRNPTPTEVALAFMGGF